MEPAAPLKVYVIAGEASGDLHGKNLVAALQQRRSGLKFRGVGGDGLAGRGMELVTHIRDTNFMGFVQVLQNLGTIRRLFKTVKADIRAWQPDVVILIDYPGFNLRMAKFIHGLGIKVYYYISPTIWAWKKGRIKQIRAYVEKMFPILPFEQEYYRSQGMEVDYCGHPLLDEMDQRKLRGDELTAVYAADGAPVVALLPGSRAQEVARMLPRMLSVVPHFPGLRFLIAGATTLDESYYRSFIGDLDVPLIMGRTYDVLDAADYALVTSGTATLETALMRVPEVVCYHANGPSVWIARRIIDVKYISLVNLIMQEEIVRELIQQDLTTDNLVQELRKLMDPTHRSQLLRQYTTLRTKLGDKGASDRLAEKLLGYWGL
jgi:lipid-A-disaccharide synthase